MKKIALMVAMMTAVMVVVALTAMVRIMAKHASLLLKLVAESA
jgi:hypothetical protein